MGIQFKLIRLDVPQFAILDDTLSGPYQVNLNANFSVNVADRVILNSIQTEYSKEGTKVLKLVTDCFFEVEKSSWDDMTKPDGAIEVPCAFLQHMAAITTGALRGELHARSGGTGLEKIVFPLINLTEIIKENLIIPTEDHHKE